MSTLRWFSTCLLTSFNSINGWTMLYQHCYYGWTTLLTTLITLRAAQPRSMVVVQHCSQGVVQHCSREAVQHCSRGAVQHYHCSQYNIVHIGCSTTLFMGVQHNIVYGGAVQHCLWGCNTTLFTWCNTTLYTGCSTTLFMRVAAQHCL